MATATKKSRASSQLAPVEMAGAALIAVPDLIAPSPKRDSRPTYGCPECGHVLHVSGLGRHRVYFELNDERSDDPVMNRVCPSCGRGLPGKSPR
jgi:predicted RNA-binding Zn-ribbon protein involved in translation (DUF1610 family)